MSNFRRYPGAEGRKSAARAVRLTYPGWIADHCFSGFGDVKPEGLNS